MSKSNSEYVSPYSVGKRQTIYIDANDPRVRGFKASITASRLGSEIVIVNDPTISISGEASYIKFAGPSANLRVPDTFDPTNSDFIQPTSIANLSAAWSGETFNITFNFDFANDANKYVQGFDYRISTSSYTPPTFEKHTTLNKSGLLQTIDFTEKRNESIFGEFQQEFSLLEVRAYDSFGNIGDTETLSLTGIIYSNDLPAPILQANAITSGYTADWTEITESYANILLEEVVSTANTAPVSGYVSVYFDKIKPAKIITGNTNKRWVRGRFAKSNGALGPLGNAVSVTPLSPITVDNTAPDAPATGNVIAGIDYDPTSQEVVGFNAYIDISWSAVNDSTLKGYRIRFKDNASSGPYTYVDSPGTGTTYRLTGLSIGTTYRIEIASYDEFNNTSSAYTNIGVATATGTPFIGKNVTTTGYFEAFPGGGSTANAFRFGFGVETGRRGLRFNANNYWYIDSSASATFKLGGDTNNYIQWDGSQFIIQGDLRAQRGQFDGNVQIKSGGSLYSGTLSGNNLSGAGFILNNTGITFNSSSVNDITTIRASDGLFTTTSAKIGNWDIGAAYANSIYSISGNNIIRLNSFDGSITISGTGYSSGIGRPDANQIVFWAGSDRSTSSPFYVTQAGLLKSTSADITGVIRVGATDMKFGDNVGNSGKSGLHISSVNYWYSNAEFSIGNGILNGDHTIVRIANSIVTATSNAVDINLAIGNSLRFLNMPSTDDDGYAGDPTITLRSDNRIVRGRRLIYSSIAADSGRSTTIDPTTKEGTISINGTNRTVKVGDLLFIDE
jgi:hypothetical protein